MAAVGPLWHRHSGAPPSRPRGMPLGARMHFATAGHGAFCFAVSIGRRPLYAHAASLSPKWPTARTHPWAPRRSSEEAKNPSRDKAPGVNTGSQLEPRNRRSVNGPSVCVAWGLHGPMAARKPSPLRFWRIDSFNCWSAVAGWPEKTGNSPLAQSRRCRLIALMTAAVR